MPIIVLGLLLQEFCPNEASYIVVLCPFKCVVGEWLHKCSKIQNTNFCHVVSSEGDLCISQHAKIVLMSCDALSFSYGIKLLNYLGQRILRYVVDEAHVVYEDSKTYRLRLNRVPQLTEFLPRPYLLLSGTYSPELESKMTGFYRANVWKVFRSPTDRQNLRLVLESLQSKSETMQVVMKFLEVYGCYSHDVVNCRAMVFVETKRLAEEWAELFAGRGLRTGRHKI